MADSHEIEAFRRKLARRDGKCAGEFSVPTRLDRAVGGVERKTEDGGRALVIEVRLTDHAENWGPLCEMFFSHLADESSALRRRIEASCGLGQVAPEDIVFLDLETTGLSSTPIFLIGAMEAEKGGLVVRQYFARNYSEERAILLLWLESVRRKKLLVTFNGKSFDVPYVQNRAVANAVPCVLDLPHFDLLHESRRDWGGDLSDCRLQTLESMVCRRPRHDDIPGYKIPTAYHDYLRTGNARDIVRILQHNLLDLVTLADLMTRLKVAE